jgi:signal transduction histidine kinase
MVGLAGEMNPPASNARYPPTIKTVGFLARKFIIIRDHGRGMDEETQSNLFQRYYRGTNTHQQVGGTGLGMAISKQLIEVQGGVIEVDSTINKGTTITLIKLSILVNI